MLANTVMFSIILARSQSHNSKEVTTPKKSKIDNLRVYSHLFGKLKTESKSGL